jgi:spermidine synthase
MLFVLFALTLLVSALLQFWMEPMFAKMILPMLGGAPSVWNTCVVFYQALLLAGYIYAHMITTWLGVRWQTIFHVGVLLLVFITLPISAAKGWTPPVSSNPSLWLFLLLVVSVGLPFFVISATAPLLQKWFTFTAHPSAKDPYFLYSASNLGSMIGLLGYPLIIEAYLPLPSQAKAWSVSYFLLAGMISACAIIALKSSRIGITHLNSEITDASPRPRVTQRIRWVLLAFVPSSLLLGVTNYITTDIAQVPLLWIIPLALYLITFILVFAPKPVLSHKLMVRVQPFLLIPLGVLFYWGFTNIVAWPFIPFHLLAFFVTATVCHGEIAYSRPSTQYLTEFYLWISAGGVLGGLFNTLVAPLAFNTLAEYPLMIVLACLLRPFLDSERSKPYERWLDIALPLAMVIIFGMSKIGLKHFLPLEDTYATIQLTLIILISCLMGALCYSYRSRPIRFGLGIGAFMLVGFLWTGERDQVLYRERNFFGIHKVLYDDSEGGFNLLFHGTTLHGAQSLNPARRSEPLTYYHRTGPLGQVFSLLLKNPSNARIASIGLGVGTIACYATPGQQWTFYEIDPAVERIARDPRYFTFLNNCLGKVAVVLGDARVSLEKAPDFYYNLIVLDAFSSDAIPMHLITRESVKLYLTKLAGDGILAFHISNRYLNLRAVLANLARDANLICVVRDDMELSEAEKKAKKAPSTWIVMARPTFDLTKLANDERWKSLSGIVKARLWTDDFSNILSVFIWTPSKIRIK